MRQVFPIIGVIALVGCSDLCSNTEVTRVLSPDGSWEAVLFSRDCGATTGFSSQVSLVKAGEMVAGVGNLFVADDGHRQIPLGEWGGPEVTLSWVAKDGLAIEYPAEARVFDQVEKKSGVTISYRHLNGN